MRNQYRHNELLIEAADTTDMTEGKKLTLYRWGNSIITKLVKEDDKVVKVHVDLTPDDKDYKKTKVIHWVPLNDKFTVKVLLIEYDHLITVKKTDDKTKIEDVVNKDSRFETVALAEIAIQDLKAGDHIQIERIGYFIIDKDLSESVMMHLIYIPDGKTKGPEILKGKVN
jgi:hypothetical protein